MVGGGRDDRRRSPALEEFRSRTPTAVPSRVGIFQPVHHGVMGTATVGVAAAPLRSCDDRALLALCKSVAGGVYVREERARTDR